MALLDQIDLSSGQLDAACEILVPLMLAAGGEAATAGETELVELLLGFEHAEILFRGAASALFSFAVQVRWLVALHAFVRSWMPNVG